MNESSSNNYSLNSDKPVFPLRQTIKRIATYTLVRFMTLFFAVVVGLYLTILVANLGGYVDKVFEGRINETILGMIRGGWLRELPPEQREAAIEAARWEMEESYGLHEPFLLRTWQWLVHGLTLDFGETRFNYSSSYFYSSDPQDIRQLIRLALPYTLTLVGTANLVVFLLSLVIAMRVSRNYGGFLDRLFVALSPISSVPPWVHGIWLIILFSAQLRVLPFPRQIEILQAENWVEYLPFLAQYAILPFLAIFISALFMNIYYWRSYFLIYSSEDYVELARAKGLSASTLERRHILRPALPYTITSFALSMIGLWQGAIALEVLFYWQGIGQMFLRAVRLFDTSMIVGIVVCFAYILVITIFILDIVCALLDPRIQIGSIGQTRQPVRFRLKGLSGWFNREKDTGSRPQATEMNQRIEKHHPQKPDADSHPATAKRPDPLRQTWAALRPILRNPPALVSGLLILLLVAVSIGTIIFIPYDQAVAMWRRDERAFIENPRMAPPVWVNFFRRDKLPETLILDSREQPATKQVKALSDGMSAVEITFSFDYDYQIYPQDLVIFMTSRYQEKKPLVDVTWLKPDGQEIRLNRFSVQSETSYYVSQDEKVKSKLGEKPISDSLLRNLEDLDGKPLAGEYQLRLTTVVFEEDSDFDARMVLYGSVYGLAGTDNNRRDLMIALLWGTPVALAFGLLGAVITTLLSMLIAAFGAWFGGWIDELIQRISDVNLILPVLPIAIMVFIMYSKSIWAILGVVVALNIFGNGIKVFRAAFLQIRELPYIEAAQVYGAGNRRIILHYLIPRMVPVLVPQLVIMVPGYVFFEATLAFLGVSDPYIPTWGKMIYEALNVSWFSGNYYWILQPIVLLLTTALAFAMLGFTLDRILNPRLRER